MLELGCGRENARPNRRIPADLSVRCSRCCFGLFDEKPHRNGEPPTGGRLFKALQERECIVPGIGRKRHRLKARFAYGSKGFERFKRFEDLPSGRGLQLGTLRRHPKRRPRVNEQRRGFAGERAEASACRSE